MFQKSYISIQKKLLLLLFIFILIRHIPVPAGQESESIEFFRICIVNDIYLISVNMLPVDSHSEADSLA